MARLVQNTASQNVTFAMLLASGNTPVTSANLTTMKSLCFVTKDNGSQAGCAGTFTECGHGQYNYSPTQGETNATDVGFLFMYTSCVAVNVDVHTDSDFTATQKTSLNAATPASIVGDVGGKVIGGSSNPIVGVGVASAGDFALARGSSGGLVLTGGVSATVHVIDASANGNEIYSNGAGVTMHGDGGGQPYWQVLYAGGTWTGPAASAAPTGSYSHTAGTGSGTVVVAAGNPALTIDQLVPTEATGYPATFTSFMGWLRARFANKVVLDSSGSTIKVYEQDGTTIMTTQSAVITTTSETQGGAS